MKTRLYRLVSRNFHLRMIWNNELTKWVKFFSFERKKPSSELTKCAGWSQWTFIILPNCAFRDNLFTMLHIFALIALHCTFLIENVLFTDSYFPYSPVLLWSIAVVNRLASDVQSHQKSDKNLIWKWLTVVSFFEKVLRLGLAVCNLKVKTKTWKLSVFCFNDFCDIFFIITLEGNFSWKKAVNRLLT